MNYLNILVDIKPCVCDLIIDDVDAKTTNESS